MSSDAGIDEAHRERGRRHGHDGDRRRRGDDRGGRREDRGGEREESDKGRGERSRLDHEHRDRRDRNGERRDKDRRSRSRSPDVSRHRRDDRGGRGDRGDRRDRDRDRERDRDRDRKRGRDRTSDDRKHRRDRTRSGDREKAVLPVKRRGPLPDQADFFAVEQQGGDGDEAEVKPPKETANFGTTGLLAAEANAVAVGDGATTVTLKYHEPAEARKPAAKDGWRLFVFKDGQIVDTVPLGQRSCWLIGREAAVVDLLAAHPSISKQHAVVQFRYVERRNEFGDRIGRVRPYVLDLASANGTRLNGELLAAQRFVELREKDMMEFGDSTREYVVMRE